MSGRVSVLRLGEPRGAVVVVAVVRSLYPTAQGKSATLLGFVVSPRAMTGIG
jgi:hypothetical protein